ncbi:MULTISPECIES: glycosyltransferase [unclassified Micromonospora]|uniref:glycosyltransferase n=1 Tax=unclassified Micromonospora TaxID=2617518 RepID=UPI002FF11312
MDVRRQSRPTVLFMAAVGVTLERFVAPISHGLAPHDVRRIAVAGRGSIPESLRHSFDEVYEVTPFRRATVRDVMRAGLDLARIVRAERPRLLHLHTPYAVALGRLVARVTGTRHLAVVQGTLFDSPDRAGRLFSLVETMSARLTPIHVTVNADDQETYRRIAPRSQVHLAPCSGAGVDPKRLQAPEGVWRAESAPPRALVMGRLTPDKNIDLAVSAWRLARQSVPELELRIVGSTVAGEPPWHAPEESGLSTAGWVSHPGAEFASADVVLLTSLREGFPITLVEALLAGTPVVAVDNRGTRAVAEQVWEGFGLVPPQPAAIASALLAQLRARTVRLRPEAAGHWHQDSVVDFHVAHILKAIG